MHEKLLAVNCFENYPNILRFVKNGISSICLKGNSLQMCIGLQGTYKAELYNLFKKVRTQLPFLLVLQLWKFFFFVICSWGLALQSLTNVKTLQNIMYM